jgi:hypothetical protein
MVMVVALSLESPATTIIITISLPVAASQFGQGLEEDAGARALRSRFPQEPGVLQR